MMSEPFLTTVEITSRSRADIPSTSFDASKPIVFEIETHNDTYQNLQHSGDIEIDLPNQAIGRVLTFSVPTQLIRKNAQAEFMFLTEGRRFAPAEQCKLSKKICNGIIRGRPHCDGCDDCGCNRLALGRRLLKLIASTR